MRKKTGFLFDLDGVLIDSEKEYSKIWKEINQEYPTGIEDLEIKIKGTTLPNILNTYYHDEATRKDVEKLLHQKENEMKYEFKDGAETLLNGLKNRQMPIALVTSSDHAKMQHLEEEIPGLQEIFDFIITGDLVKKSKPDPEGYLLAASKIECQPKNCAVFEDSLQGVKAGSKSGAYVVGVAGTLPSKTISPFSHIVLDTLVDFDIDGVIEILKNR